MADLIQAIFVTPGLAFARLGGSSTPQFAYDWIDTRAPRADGETSIAPTWTIAIQPDGSPAPFMPDSVTFRDGDLVRPSRRSTRSGRASAMREARCAKCR